MIIFLVYHQNSMRWFRREVTTYKTICCDPSSEPSRRDGSDEGSQHMVLCRINKNYPSLSPNTPSYLELRFGEQCVAETMEYKRRITSCFCDGFLVSYKYILEKLVFVE